MSYIITRNRDCTYIFVEEKLWDVEMDKILDEVEQILKTELFKYPAYLLFGSKHAVCFREKNAFVEKKFPWRPIGTKYDIIRIRNGNLHLDTDRLLSQSDYVRNNILQILNQIDSKKSIDLNFVEYLDETVDLHT